jgi:hypothetical protein
MLFMFATASMLARLLAIANLQQAPQPLSFCLAAQNIVDREHQKKEVLR